MAEATQEHGEGPVTVVITRTVLPGKEQAYEAWIKGALRALAVPGAVMKRPVAGAVIFAALACAGCGAGDGGAGGAGGGPGDGGAGGAGGGGGAGGAAAVCEAWTERPCYTGPGGTAGVGACLEGFSICNGVGTAWGPCEGEVTPAMEQCETPADDDCDGVANDGCAGP